LAEGGLSRRIRLMNHKLIYSGISIMSMGTVAIIIAIVMEIQTGEPVYLLMMKIAAGLFGIGGPLLGWGIAKSKRRDWERK